PIVVYVPGAAYAMSGIGVASGVQQYASGETGKGTLAFDLATSLAPIGMKAMSGKVSSIGQWARPRVAGAFMQMSIGVENVPGLSGRGYAPTLPWEPSSGMVLDANGRPASFGGGNVSAPAPTVELPTVGPQTNARPGVWQTAPSGNTPFQPYQIPFTV